MDNGRVPKTADTGGNRLIAERYRLEQRIGGGAMGIVWAGTDELLRRPVAVKEVLLPAGMPETEAAELRERALREARAIALLTHPNVVTLYDVAREDGEPFVVMELVPSQSLSAVLAEHGPLSDQQLAVIADGVAAALESAHRSGIVHRDVKPGNVLIGDDGRIKLSDFGISRNVAEHTITATGIMLGTPAFIAPEIATGDPVTAAADLWGLGATLFAASTGEPPYDAGDHPVATINAVVSGPVPAPPRHGPLAEVISGLMVKDPAARMPPHEVRKRVQHLLPVAGSLPFGMLIDPEAPTVRVPVQQKQRQPTRTPQEPEPAALASDPGPLPFMLSEDAPAPAPARRRFRWGVLVLVCTALVVFLIATVAGFAGVRIYAGEPPLPGLPGGASPVQPPRTVRYVDDANGGNGADGGSFSVLAPAGWDTFRDSRERPAESRSVRLVSPDGTSEVAVERFPGYYREGHTMQEFIDTLPERTGSPPQISLNQAMGESAGGGEPDRRLVYVSKQTSLLGAAAAQAPRTTYAYLTARDGDLWVVRVDSNQAQAGDQRFKEALDSFRTPA